MEMREIKSDEEDENCRFGRMTNAEDVYIYKLRVERADRKRRVRTQAKFKDVSTQTWADLSSRASRYEIWYDDADWEIILHAINTNPAAYQILQW